MIKDITGENNPPLIDSNNSISSNSLVTQRMAEANDRPQILHSQIGVLLASRVSFLSRTMSLSGQQTSSILVHHCLICLAHQSKRQHMPFSLLWLPV